MFNPTGKWLKIMAGFVFVSLLLAPLCGCITKSRAEVQARMAYLAGQRDALMQLQQHSNEPGISFIGQVNNHFITWSDGLTLSQGIVKAVFNAPSDPQSIVIHRNGQDIRTTPAQLLQGNDLPLLPGDVVEIH
jgi:hypothetical protein